MKKESQHEMGLNDLIRQKSVVHVIPGLRETILAEIRRRYQKEIEPTLWKAYFDDNDPDNEFLNTTAEIVGSVLRQFVDEKKLATLTESQMEYLESSLWDESQLFWHDQFQTLQPAFSFIEHILKNAQSEIDNLFPNSERILGPMTRSLLVDLAFQHNLFTYAKATKKDLVDFRRMVNISGQIVESAVLFSRMFPKEELSIGAIHNRLKGYRSATNSERRAFFARLPKGNLLQSKEFIGNLSTLVELRNAYSHGGTSREVTEDDFRRCVIALIDTKTGVLPKLYEALKDAKR